MNTDILEWVTSSFGGPALRQASAFLGESEAGTRAAVRSVAPTLLAGALQKVAMPGGVGDLMRKISSDTVDPGLGGTITDVLSNRGGVEQLIARGEPLANSLLGTRTGSATEAIAETSGIKPSSVAVLLSMVAPLLFGFLKKHVTQGHLDAGGLSNLLLSQRGALERTGLDSRITSALGFGSLSSLLGSIPGAGAVSGAAAAASGTLHSAATAASSTLHSATAAIHPVERKSRWLPWAVGIGAVLLAMFLWSNFSARRATERAASVADSAVTGTATRLQVAGLPAKVYFEPGVADVPGGDRVKLAAVASTIRADGGAVAITGYTDHTGSPDQNLALAKDRAAAVRSALVAEGVSETKIVLQPPAFVTGTGSNDEARRVEITSQR